MKNYLIGLGEEYIKKLEEAKSMAHIAMGTTSDHITKMKYQTKYNELKAKIDKIKYDLDKVRPK